MGLSAVQYCRGVARMRSACLGVLLYPGNAGNFFRTPVSAFKIGVFFFPLPRFFPRRSQCAVKELGIPFTAIFSSALS